MSASTPPTRPRRPRWSLKTSFYGAIATAIVSLGLVHGVARGNLWQELEWVAGGAVLALFAFFAFALHRGVRALPRERMTVAWLHLETFTSHAGTGVDPSPLFEGGIIAGLLGLVLSIVLAVVVLLLSWLGVNLAIATFAAVFLPLFAFFRRSVRTVLAKGRRCRGDLRASLRHAATSALLYGAWFYLLLLTIRLLRS